MKKRIRLRGKKKHGKGKWFLLVFLFLFLIVYLLLHFLGREITPILLETAELKIESLSSYIANQALSDLIQTNDFSDLYETITSEDGSIQRIDFHSTVVNQLLNTSIRKMIDLFQQVERGELSSSSLSSFFSEEELSCLSKGILQEVPLGLVTGNPLLSNLGPKIPIRVHYVGDVEGNVTTNIQSYGINNALVKVNLNFTFTAQIQLPYLTQEKPMSFEIPLFIQMIPGKIPTYYGGEIIGDSNLYTLPIH